MMNKSHSLSGAVAFLAAAPLVLPVQPVGNLIVGSAICAVAATLPDLDHQNSKPTKLLRAPLWRVLPHRGPTHHLWSSVALAAILWPLGGWSWWTVAIVLGWTVHHLGDMITVEGLRWLWPAPVRIRGLIHAGGKVEKGIIFPMLAIWLVWLAWPILMNAWLALR